MLYDAVDLDTGEHVTIDVPHGTFGLDDVLTCKGRRFKRRINLPEAKRGFTPFTTMQAPFNDPLAPRTDEKGRAVFLNRTEVQNYCNATQAEGRRVQYEPDCQ